MDKQELPRELPEAVDGNGDVLYAPEYRRQITPIYQAALKQLEEAQAILDARLCEKHQESRGLFGYQEGDGLTKRGGGCAVCIGMRVDRELEEARMEGIKEQNKNAATKLAV